MGVVGMLISVPLCSVLYVVARNAVNGKPLAGEKPTPSSSEQEK